MRIAVDATAAVSGGKVYLAHLLPGLAQLATEHEFIVFHLGDLAERSPTPGRRFQFRRVRLPAFTTGHRLAGSMLKMLWRLVVWPWHLHRLQPDLLFSNAGFGLGWRPARTKAVLALHNSMPLQDELCGAETSLIRRLRLVLLRRLMGETLRHCDGVIVFSEDLKQRICSRFDHLKKEPSVVYHGIEWGEAERKLAPDLGRLAGLGIRPPYLLYVSHFHRYKNVLRLLEAFALVRNEHPGLSLVLAGEAADPAYWSEVEEAISRLGLGASVRRVGGRSREELKDIYRAALAFVYPSLAENCPFAVLEALALGLPIAAARASSLPEICGEAALFFDPHKPVEMAEVMGRLINRKPLREELSRKAVARAQMFSWPEAARQTLRIFEQVAETGLADHDWDQPFSQSPAPHPQPPIPK
jgi:glycosyltransferase involved in cell wall biosynthesis